MISVDTRTFEIGILRMVGLDRLGVIGVLIAQALLYSIPGWILGIILGFVGNFVVMYILEDSSSVPLQKLMPVLSIVISTLIAFGISLIASILPIRQALSQNLHDSIDVTHTKASAIMVTIERAEALQKPWGLLLSGIILTGIGVGVYFFMPLAMLSMNMMMLSILFFILLTMILISLIMLALNVEFLLERLLAVAFLFWEARAVKTLAVKNLGAHRMRNRKTTLLFSISLAFIVFVNVMVSIALSMIDTMIYMERGCNLDVRGQPYGRGGGGTNSMVMSLLGMSSTRFNPTVKYIENPKAVEDILMKNDKFKDKVLTISWATHKLETIYPSASRTQVANQGRSHAFYHQIVGVSPNILEGANHNYVQMGKGKKTSDDVIRQLYTHSFEGFSAVLSNGLRNEMGADLGQVFMVNIVPFSSVTGGGGLLESMAEFLENSLSRRNLTTSSYMKALPFINMPSATLSLSDDPDVPVSIPTYLQLLPDGYGDYENIKYEHMFVKLKKGVTREEEVEMYDELRSYRQDPEDDQSRLGVWSYQNVLKFIQQAGDIINIAFMAITILVMILCFFSLMSSMHTNVMEQQKEIGIMRALGLTAFQLLRVYVEEAFILVITAAFMGLVVGMLVGYMLISQMSSLQGLPVPFFFPWELALIMIAMAVVTSILSAAQPAYSVMRKSIVTVMKSA
ncbi:MAG: putative DUF214 family protein [Streblomastix strix]|uniref:Putative DUF214 family protein n=1 Tax=Streblomastix strix TaxID=222440 RepID=A0A5J4VC73_9EUKA|nr:MAG: putative DUF214 family protein [Streblomastix strix]